MAANILYGAGYSVIGVSDVHGGIINTLGINITKLMAHVLEAKTVVGFADAEPISGEDLLVQPCDILLPAATENQITHENADRIQARVICEGANGPTTAQADEILYDKKFSSFPTFWQTPVASRFLTLNGCKTDRVISGILRQ
jgi:glutamate dehydrogenase (NAD(P)+)